MKAVFSPKSEALEAPGLPLDFIGNIFVERSVIALRAWLAQNAPPDVQEVFASLEWAHGVLLTAQTNGGHVYPSQNVDVERYATPWLKALLSLSAQVGEPFMTY